MKQDSFYITTPIYYPSGQPHMGHAYSSIIADVFARFKRNENLKVFFLTGTDEHGLKIQRAAEKNSKSPEIFCNEISESFKKFSKKLNLSNDDFIRTTEQRHNKAVTNLWNKLIDSGNIYPSKYKGWYSMSDEAYYSDKEILDKGGKKVSALSGSPVEWVEEDSFFFKLSAWEKKLLEFYSKNEEFITPIGRRNEVIKFVKSGLTDLSVSRTSFTWGIKVPKNPNHVIYVWLDALTNYISALNYPDEKSELYQKFWPASLHVIGKDILRFHAVYWPAFLLAANLPLPKRIFSHGWIMSGEEKMSKSKGNILNPLEIIEKYGIDELRYYLMKEVSHGSDGNISLSNLEKCVNSDLANNFGNLCQRVISFINNNCEGKVSRSKNLSKSDLNLINQTIKLTSELKSMINNLNLNSYIKTVVDISFLTNKYINDEEPWKLRKENPEKMNNILHVSLEQIAKISILLNPIIPIASSKVLDALNIKNNERNLEFLNNKDSSNILKKDLQIKNLNILFKKFS